ncbi:MAG: hypothetical protein ACD_62C00275G0001, partial [uncultured bacterium]
MILTGCALSLDSWFVTLKGLPLTKGTKTDLLFMEIQFFGGSLNEGIAMMLRPVFYPRYQSYNSARMGNPCDPSALLPQRVSIRNSDLLAQRVDRAIVRGANFSHEVPKEEAVSSTCTSPRTESTTDDVKRWQWLKLLMSTGTGLDIQRLSRLLNIELPEDFSLTPTLKPTLPSEIMNAREQTACSCGCEEDKLRFTATSRGRYLWQGARLLPDDVTGAFETYYPGEDYRLR